MPAIRIEGSSLPFILMQEVIDGGLTHHGFSLSFIVSCDLLGRPLMLTNQVCDLLLNPLVHLARMVFPLMSFPGEEMRLFRVIMAAISAVAP